MAPAAAPPSLSLVSPRARRCAASGVLPAHFGHCASALWLVCSTELPDMASSRLPLRGVQEGCSSSNSLCKPPRPHSQFHRPGLRRRSPQAPKASQGTDAPLPRHFERPVSASRPGAVIAQLAELRRPATAAGGRTPARPAQRPSPPMLALCLLMQSPEGGLRDPVDIIQHALTIFRRGEIAALSPYLPTSYRPDGGSGSQALPLSVSGQPVEERGPLAPLAGLLDVGARRILPGHLLRRSRVLSTLRLGSAFQQRISLTACTGEEAVLEWQLRTWEPGQEAEGGGGSSPSDGRLRSGGWAIESVVRDAACDEPLPTTPHPRHVPSCCQLPAPRPFSPCTCSGGAACRAACWEGRRPCAEPRCCLVPLDSCWCRWLCPAIAAAVAASAIAATTTAAAAAGPLQRLWWWLSWLPYSGSTSLKLRPSTTGGGV